MHHRFELMDDEPPILDDGRAEFRVVIVPLEDDGETVDDSIPQHGETVYCPHQDGHTHTKACVKPLLLARQKDDKGNDIDGTSAKEKAEKWLANQRAKRATSKAGKVTLDKKEVEKETVEGGRRVSKAVEVPDRDLTL